MFERCEKGSSPSSKCTTLLDPSAARSVVLRKKAAKHNIRRNEFDQEKVSAVVPGFEDRSGARVKRGSVTQVVLVVVHLLHTVA